MSTQPATPWGLPAPVGLLALCALLAVPHAAWAGRNCEAVHPPKLQTVVRALELAERTRQTLEASGAQVVILARAGQDLRKYGLRYSHLGFAYRVPNTQPVQWRVLHKLNQCGTASSALYRQGLGDFFMDDLWRFEAAWVTPTPAVQAALMAWLGDPERALSLHQPSYSMVSYVWGRKYQQSNQWAIETLALALQPTRSPATPGLLRAQAQAWLQAQGYQPTTLTIGPLTRLGGRMTAANVAFDDHPNEKRFADRIETVTVDSVFSWMPAANLSGPMAQIR